MWNNFLRISQRGSGSARISTGPWNPNLCYENITLWVFMHLFILLGKLRYEVVSQVCHSGSALRTKSSPPGCVWVKCWLQDVSVICLWVNNPTSVTTKAHSQQWRLLKLAESLPKSQYLLFWSSYIILHEVYRETVGFVGKRKGVEGLSHLLNLLQILLCKSHSLRSASRLTAKFSDLVYGCYIKQNATVWKRLLLRVCRLMYLRSHMKKFRDGIARSWNFRLTWNEVCVCFRVKIISRSKLLFLLNRRLTWVGRDLKGHQVPTSCRGWFANHRTMHQVRLPMAPSNLAMNTSVHLVPLPARTNCRCIYPT